MRKDFPVRTVRIIGGTHGNELTGIFLLRRWQTANEEIQRPSLEVATLLGNPRAFKHNRRYIDNDLNRRFALSDLADLEQASYEETRAQAVNAVLGPKGDAPQTDFIFDLHTTTSNMGITLVLQSLDALHFDIAAYIQQHIPEAVIFSFIRPPQENNYICSVARYGGLIIEVGPTPQGVLRADIFEKTRRALLAGLDFLELRNQGRVTDLPETLEAFEFIEKLSFPTDAAGQRIGMIHEAVQDRDYQPLHPGDPLFRTVDGGVVHYQGETTVYPCFINEAAYYDQNHALSLMRKVTLQREAA